MGHGASSNFFIILLVSESSCHSILISLRKSLKPSKLQLARVATKAHLQEHSLSPFCKLFQNQIPEVLLPIFAARGKISSALRDILGFYGRS